MSEYKSKAILEVELQTKKASQKAEKLRKEVAKIQGKKGTISSEDKAIINNKKAQIKQEEALIKRNNKWIENQEKIKTKRALSQAGVAGKKSAEKLKQKNKIELKEITKQDKEAARKAKDPLEQEHLTKNSASYKRNIKGIQAEMAAQGMSTAQQKKGIRNLEENMKSAGMRMTEAGDWTNKTTKSIIKQGRAMSYASSSAMPKFQAQFLSLMFLGQGLSATFGGMIQKTLQMTGIFDAFSGVLASVLLPVLMPLIAKYLPKLIEWLEKGDNKKFAASFIIFAAALGTVIAQLSQFALLFSSLGISLKDVGVFMGTMNKSMKSLGKSSKIPAKGFSKMLKSMKSIKKVGIAKYFKKLGENKFFKALGANKFLKVLGKAVAVLNIITGIFDTFAGILHNDIWKTTEGILNTIGGIAIFFGPIGWAISAILFLITGFGKKLEWVRFIGYTLASPFIMIAELIAKIVQSVDKMFNLDWKGLVSLWTNWGWSDGNQAAVNNSRDNIKENGFFARARSMDLSGNIKPEAKLATGGIVTSPTTALIGEAGPEAVIPLSRVGESGIGNTINYNPTINVEMSGSNFSGEDLAAKINEALHDNLRSGF